MKVLVTGGAGFIGSHLVDAYLARKDQVIIVDDLSSGQKKNIDGALRQGASFYPCSILAEEFKTIVANENPDLINHHAAQKSVRDSVANPKKDAEINLLGLIQVLEAARKVNCRNIIFASSGGAIYGEQKFFPATEEHPKDPLSPYGISKYASELYLKFYVEQYSMQCTCLRYANVYGPRQDPEGEAGVVAIFSSRLAKNVGAIIYGSGEQTRDFVFVSDIVEANLSIEKGMKNFQAYNVGTGRETSIADLYQILSVEAGVKSKPSFEAAKAGEQLRSSLSNGKINEFSAWNPRVNVQDGLNKTYPWFKERS